MSDFDPNAALWLTCLQIAGSGNHTEPADAVIERAKAYRAFLDGVPVPSKKRKYSMTDEDRAARVERLAVARRYTQKYTVEQVDKAVQMREAGATVPEISAALNITAGSVDTSIRRAIHRRDPSRGAG